MVAEQVLAAKPVSDNNEASGFAINLIASGACNERAAGRLNKEPMLR